MANFDNFEDAVADSPGVYKNSENSTVRRSQLVAGKMVSLTTEQFKELLASVSQTHVLELLVAVLHAIMESVILPRWKNSSLLCRHLKQSRV